MFYFITYCVFNLFFISVIFILLKIKYHKLLNIIEFRSHKNKIKKFYVNHSHLSNSFTVLFTYSWGGQRSKYSIGTITYNLVQCYPINGVIKSNLYRLLKNKWFCDSMYVFLIKLLYVELYIIIKYLILFNREYNQNN